MKNVLNPLETVIKPNLGWGPYKTMAAESNITLTDYNMFSDGAFDIEDFKKTLTTVMDKQGKVLVIINDPCHNPSGYTLKGEEWDKILAFTNELSKKGPVIILHDIAYVDYNHEVNDWKKHFKKYSNLAENVMIVIAFSCSKTLTAYGARVGAQVVITKDKKQLETFKNAAIYSARSIWSTVNNSAMKLFSTIINNEKLREEYMIEKQFYIDLLRDRASIFVNEAKKVGLNIYPHTEGDEQEKELLNIKLQENNIFTVEVDSGLRVAICSVPKRKLQGLATRIKNII